MSFAIVSIGNDDYLSYASVEEADEYLAADAIRNIAWTALPDPVKISRLVSMKRRLNLMPWVGTRVTSFDFTDPVTAQQDVFTEDAWPRKGVRVQGIDYPADQVPGPIAEATIIGAAGSVENADILTIPAAIHAKLKKVGSGGDFVEYWHDNALEYDSISFQAIDPTIHALIQPFLAQSNVGARQAFGTGFKAAGRRRGGFNNNDANNDRRSEGL